MSAREKGLRLDVEYLTQLPPLLHGDESRIRQVLFNLLGNAVKLTEAGFVRIETLHRSTEDGVEIHIAVRDSGIGIAADVLPVLFERFTQADSGVARRFGGTGLGWRSAANSST